MKKKLVLIACSILLTMTGCGAESENEVVLHKEEIPVVEEKNEITQEQALEAIKNYCYINNPDLENMANSEDVTVYFDVSTNEADEIVVLYRSYTGAQIRYYVNPTSGDVYVTEFVPGIIDEEQRTGESFNIKDYSAKKSSASVGGEVMPDQLQQVYIVPAGDGTLVCTAHYSIEAAEGFGHGFAYMMDTLIITGR